MWFSNLDTWPLFIVFYSLLLVVSFVIARQSRRFYTKDPVVRKFSIMELEVPATPLELKNLITGLYALPPVESKKSINALRGQLLVDFLFMPLAYGSVFLLCWRVAHKMQLQFGYYVFMAFACLQVVPWICDVIENIYLLRKINPAVTKTDDAAHRRFLWMEAIKWGIALVATACAASAVCYFWLTGNYSTGSFWYLLICFAETLVFCFAIKSPKARIESLAKAK